MGQGATSMTQAPAPVYDRTPTPVSADALLAQKMPQAMGIDPKMMMLAQLLKQGAPQQAMQSSPVSPYSSGQTAYQQALNQFNSSR